MHGVLFCNLVLGYWGNGWGKEDREMMSKYFSRGFLYGHEREGEE